LDARADSVKGIYITTCSWAGWEDSEDVIDISAETNCTTVRDRALDEGDNQVSVNHCDGGAHRSTGGLEVGVVVIAEVVVGEDPAEEVEDKGDV
jgi:hypothetical protein